MSQQPNNEDRSFIELNRRFRKLDQKAKTEEAALESYTKIFFGRELGFGWDDLLKESRVVVLGEPGSGKSWELRERVKILSSRGVFAFFIRLDQLVERDLQTLLDTDERQRLIKWKQSPEPAYFFLDSVDEAKFRKVSDFHATLERFRNEIGFDSLIRAKIILSSRISEWQPYSDGFAFQQLFPLPPTETRVGNDQSKKTDNPKENPLVVHLEPLDKDQVESFVRAKGISNVREFVTALDGAFAWEFARRPLDVSDLIGFWKENGRIGSLTELIEFDISSKLRSRTDRVEIPLSDIKKREGAEWLAAASIFSRKFSFCVPDEGSIDADSLNPLACLPAEWRDDEARAVLSRAIFDSAVYGRLRFHHRRVGEYLAAKWIAARMEHGCLLIELEQILIETVRGRKVLRPALRPIAAWLCCGDAQWNAFVRGLVLGTDPGIHLKYGDPASLSIDYRRQVLSALAGFSKNRKRMWIESSADCLARLANPALSLDIATLISNRGLATDFRIELLDIVRHGRLEACVNTAMNVIASPDEPDELKSHAAMAVGAMENPQTHSQLFQTVNQLPHISNQLCASVFEVLYPKTISSAELLQLLAKIEKVRDHGLDLPYYLESHFESVVTPNDAGALLKLLLVLVQTPPHVLHGQKTIPVSAKFYWIGKTIPTVLNILFKKPTFSSEESDVVVEAIQLLGHMREFHREFSQDEINKLNEATLQHPQIRQNYLWRVAAAFRTEHKKEATHSVELFDHWEVLRFSRKDFSWLTEDIKKRSDPNDRLLALRLAIEAWDASGRTLTGRMQLRRAIRHDVVLRDVFRNSVFIRPLFPLKRFWYRKIRYRYGKWWWQQKIDSVQRFWRWLRSEFLLLRHLRLLASGKRIDWLNILLHEANEKNSSHWTMVSWTDLIKKRGKWIANAAKRGCMTVWRGYNPPLPHEKPESNRTTIGVLVGLTGLQVEFQENLKAISKLTEDEAKLATRYAMDELNGFPAWFENLAAVHPNAVGKILCECIEAEWQFPADRKETNEVLADLAWHGERLVHLVQEKLLSLLDAGDPQNYSILRFALSVLMRQTNPRTEIMVKLAAQRAPASNDIGVTVLWLAVWMQIDGEAAVKCLQTLLNNSTSPNVIVERLCSVLSGEEMQRGPFVTNPNYLRPICLRHFVPLVYAHVKFSDDINRADGGAYTPTARDHAQQFRNVLLDRLAKDEALEATDFLRDLADELAMAQVRDWILNLLDQRLEREADVAPWTPADLRTFADQHEIDPKNDKELFAIARKRLQILKWDVEKSDNSKRDDLRVSDTEMFLRRWLQRNLMERSQKRYNIPQEGEIDQQERPDLRLENPKTDPVSIEIKWADSWTLPQLLERLENQLVGQYLRAHNSRFGIFLLGFIGKKQHWDEPNTGKQLTFPEVVEIVTQRALTLMQKDPKIAGLEVISIDFSQPKKIKPTK